MRLPLISANLAVMFELTGTQYEKGRFELRLEKVEYGPKKWLIILGPVRGRVVALTLFLLSSLLLITNQPAKFCLKMGWIQYGPDMLKVQNIVTWVLMIVGLVVYFSVFALKRAELTLVFDRVANGLRYSRGFNFTAQGTQQGLIPFQEIETFKVHGPDRKPRTPYGYIEIGAKKGATHFRFRVLSEDQFKIYPANIARILDRSPVGDWVDPDAEEVAPPNHI